MLRHQKQQLLTLQNTITIICSLCNIKIELFVMNSQNTFTVVVYNLKEMPTEWLADVFVVPDVGTRDDASLVSY